MRKIISLLISITLILSAFSIAFSGEIQAPAYGELFKVDFSQISDGTYTAAQLQNLTNGVIKSTASPDTQYAQVNITDGVAKVTANGGAARLYFYLPTELTSGCVHFDFDITAWGYYLNSNETQNPIRINGTEAVMGTCPQNGTLFMAPTGATFEGGATTYDNTINGTPSYKLRVEMMSETESDNWTVNVYHTEKSLSTPILTTTLARAKVPALKSIGASFGPGGTEPAINRIAYKSVTATLVDPNSEDDSGNTGGGSIDDDNTDQSQLFEVDFSQILNGTYTAAQLEALTDSVIKNTTTPDTSHAKVVVENGIAKVISDVDGNPSRMFFYLPQELKSGCVHFDFDIASWGHYNGVETEPNNPIRINNATGLIGTLKNDGSKFQSPSGMTFVNGETIYDATIGDAVSLKLRIEIMSETETSDWTINIYHTENSLTAPILTTMLTRTAVPSLKNIGTAFGTGDGNHISYKSVSAKLADPTVQEPEKPIAEVLSVTPEDGKISIASSKIEVNFKNPIEESILDAITTCDENGNDVVISKSLSENKQTVILVLSGLADGKNYTLNVEGENVKAFEKTFTADASKDFLFNVDFSEIEDGTYTTAQLQTLTNGVIKNTTTPDTSYARVVVEGGVGRVKADADGNPSRMFFYFPSPIKSGCVQIDLDITSWGHYNGSDSEPGNPIRINNATGLIGTMKNNGSTFQTPTGLKFTNGSTTYDNAIDGNASYNLRIIATSATESDDWTINIYHTHKSLSTPILTTKLSRAKTGNLTNIGTAFGTGDGTVNTNHISYKSVSAKMVKIKAPTTKNAIMPDEDITLVFPTALVVGESSDFDIILETMDGIKISAEALLDGDTLVLKPNDYLKYNSEYRVVYGNLTDADGYYYEGSLKISTGNKKLSVKSVVNKYYSETNAETELTTARKILSNVTLNNTDGENYTVFAVLTAYDENGILVGAGVSTKTTSSSSEIPLEVTIEALDGTAKTVKTTVFYEKNNIITKIN